MSGWTPVHYIEQIVAVNHITVKKAVVLVSSTDSLNMELDPVKYLNVYLRYLKGSLVGTTVLFLLTGVFTKPKKK